MSLNRPIHKEALKDLQLITKREKKKNISWLTGMWKTSQKSRALEWIFNSLEVLNPLEETFGRESLPFPRTAPFL